MIVFAVFRGIKLISMTYNNYIETGNRLTNKLIRICMYMYMYIGKKQAKSIYRA